MTKHFAEVVIRNLNWQPYIEGHWLNLSRQRGGVIITFKNHTEHKLKCSNKTADELLQLAKERSE